MSRVLIEYNGYIAIVSLLAECSGALQVLARQGERPLTESQQKALHELQGRVALMLESMKNIGGSGGGDGS